MISDRTVDEYASWSRSTVIASSCPTTLYDTFSDGVTAPSSSATTSFGNGHSASTDPRRRADARHGYGSSMPPSWIVSGSSKGSNGAGSVPATLWSIRFQSVDRIPMSMWATDWYVKKE